MSKSCIQCEICPYGIDDYEHRYKYLGDNYQPEYCWCDKVGGKHYIFGYCNECDNVYSKYKHYSRVLTNNSTFTDLIPRSKTNKRDIVYRRKMNKMKDERLKKIIRMCGYAPHIGYINWGWIDGRLQEIGTYIKYPKNSNRQKWIKKMTSKKFRNSDVSNGNSYRRLVDYWWIMY